MFKKKDDFEDNVACDFANELAKDLRRKKIRKYLLIALAGVIVVSTIVGLNIENKDSKLPDGQGNSVKYEQQDDKKSEVSADKKEDKKDDENADGDKSDKKTDNKADSKDNGKNDSQSSSGNKKPSTSSNKKPSNSSNKKPVSEDTKVDNSDDFTASNGGNSAYKPEEEEKISVTISIRCDSVSKDLSKLTNQSVKPYIPSNGVILGTTTYKCTTDNTVFDALNTVCRNNGIQLEFSYTPMYEAYYIEGINHLYEFDAGSVSGWMYKVNGWFPNYGCSSYYLSDGDVIEWVYTCDLGADVGNIYMG